MRKYFQRKDGAEVKVLSLCDLTGNMVRPWAAAGYHCTIVDLQHQNGTTPAGGEWENIDRVGCDVKRFRPYLDRHCEFDIVFAFPPCTDLAVSGSRWMKEKGLQGLIEALKVVEACRRICERSRAPWMLENPVSTISSYWRKPDHTFHPYHYGDPYTKATCLWVGGGFRMPPIKNPVEPTEGSKMWLMPPSEERANLRSATPKGFAQAVFETMDPVIRNKASA